jgi:RNA polymerase sigma-70 factor (ECF subfamily)
VEISYAEDIVNNVFELFCKKWNSLENKNYKSWLYETANNLLKNFYKKQKRKKEKETYIDESIIETLSYEQNFENINDDEIEKYKIEILEILTEKERQLFDMKYVKKLSRAQISEKLHIPENTVKQRLYRLREKIKNEAENKLK